MKKLDEMSIKEYKLKKLALKTVLEHLINAEVDKFEKDLGVTVSLDLNDSLFTDEETNPRAKFSVKINVNF